MSTFTNYQTTCAKCKKPHYVQLKDYKAGAFKCMHCTHLNPVTTITYDESILQGLPHYGALVAMNNPAERYPLQIGPNVIGVGKEADIQLARDTYIHNGKCYISRRHCTLTVAFDTRKGQLRYLIEDGALNTKGQREASLNFTFYQNKKMESQDALYLNDQDLINLGGEDAFRLQQYVIPEQMLETYQIRGKKDDDDTTG
jgi:hypothetical protein